MSYFSHQQGQYCRRIGKFVPNINIFIFIRVALLSTEAKGLPTDLISLISKDYIINKYIYLYSGGATVNWRQRSANWPYFSHQLGLYFMRIGRFVRNLYLNRYIYTRNLNSLRILFTNILILKVKYHFSEQFFTRGNESTVVVLSILILHYNMYYFHLTLQETC